jgi:hypothetical protein
MSPHTNGVVKARKVFILMFGVIVSMIGTAVDVVVLLRDLYPVAPLLGVFDIKIFSIGTMIFFAGLALIFTGDPLRVFALVRSQLPGGRRATDPPPESAPLPLPREKWPKPDETWRPKRGD